MAKGETWKKWADDNIVRVYINLNRTNDADILEALDQVDEPRGTALKRLVRLGIEAEKKKK
ncbi:MAG: hypothetical protein IJH54_08570 [Clostridia bacterium]|nr:hypothetical protein [Clostridia bacterium]